MFQPAESGGRAPVRPRGRHNQNGEPAGPKLAISLGLVDMTFLTDWWNAACWPFSARAIEAQRLSPASCSDGPIYCHRPIP
jgi:hypothetical protein